MITSLRYLQSMGIHRVVLSLLGEGKDAKQIAALIGEDLDREIDPAAIQRYIDNLKGGTLPLQATAQAREKALLQQRAIDQYRVWSEMLAEEVAKPEMTTRYTKDGKPYESRDMDRIKAIEIWSRRALEWHKENRELVIEREAEVKAVINQTNITFNPVAFILQSVKEGKMSGTDVDYLLKNWGGEAVDAKFTPADLPPKPE